MASENFLTSIELVDGTTEGFSLDSLTDNKKLYFVRSTPEGDNGFIYLNGKQYGAPIKGGEF